MRAHRFTLIPILILVALAATPWASPARAQPTSRDEVMMQRFDAGIELYVRLHRDVERALEPIVPTDDVDAIFRAVEARADGIRRARPHATRGDLFTPPVARILRMRIADALRAHGFTAADLLDDISEGYGARHQRLLVNGPFPWSDASGMLTCLAEVLPALPQELEYRLVGRDLVLLDISASLVVDFLPNALAGPNQRTTK